MRSAFFKVISILFFVLLMNDTVEAGSLNYEVFAITSYAPYLEAPCFDGGNYLSTCNNTNPAYVGASQGSGTLDSLNYNWNSGNINIGGNNYSASYRMIVITGYWQHPGTSGQTSTVYFAGRNDDGLIVNINNTPVVSDWAQQGPRYWNSNGSFSGVGGQWYPIQINWYEYSGSANMDIHYRIDGNNATNTTSGWLDMNNNHFALTLTVQAGITSSQQTSVTNTKNTSSTTNNIYITQSGSSIDLNILQDGDNNVVIGTDLTSAGVISGDNNDVDIAQYSNNNILGIDISGNSNDVDIWQDLNQRAIIDINGASNTLALKQEDLNGSGAHYTNIDLDGNNNILSLWQKETGDKILFMDIGNSNNVTTLQHGTGDHFLDINLGDSHTVNVEQDGSGTHNAYISLTGNSSSLTLTQDSSSNMNYHLDQNCTNPSCSATVTQN